MADPPVSDYGGTSIIFGENEAKRLVKILQQIAENLERQNIIDVKSILTDIVRSSKKADQTTFDENVNKFVEIVIFKAGISVNLLKQAVRGFIMIKRQPKFGDLFSKLVSHLLVEEFPSLARMGEIDDESFRLYIKALEEKEEKVRHVRLMIVGMFGVGKTCVARRLCNEGIDNVKSTVGIDLKINACEVDKKGKWFVRDEKSRNDKEFPKRLDKVMQKVSITGKSMETEAVDSQQQLGSDVQASTSNHAKPISPKQNDEKIQDARNAFENSNEAEKPLIGEFKDTIKSFQTNEYTRQRTEAIPKQGSRRSTTVSIWDFAGQSVYYSTHHFFLSSRSIYLLILDISKELDEKVSENKPDADHTLLKGCMPEGFTCGDALRFWINSIYTYARDSRSPSYVGSSSSTQYKPTIVLIGTHKDELEGTDEEKEQYKDEYFRKALEPMEKNPARDYIHNKTFLISCLENSPETYDGLRGRIIEIAKGQPFWKEPIPAKWIPLERTIEEEKSKGNSYIEFKDLEEKDSENEVHLDNQRQIRLFLQFQHICGNIIYYNVENLNKKIIMDPQWIIDMFKLFVTHYSTFEAADLEDMWKEYRKKAILRLALFKHLIENNGKSEDKSSTEEKAKLVQYIMEHLDVIARPVTLRPNRAAVEKDHTEENSRVVGLDKEDFFIVPSMLKKMTSTETENHRDYFQPNEKKAETTSVLCLVFENQFLPPAIFHGLLATCIRKWEAVKKGREYLLFNGMGVFRLDHQQTLTIWYAEYVICMRISAFPANVAIDSNKCKEVKEEISNMLVHILLLDKQKKTLVDEDTDMSVLEPFGEYILCKESLEKSIAVMFKDPCESGLLEVKRLRFHESLYCECGANHGVSRSEVLKYWYPDIVPIEDPNEATENYFNEILEKYGSLDRVPDDMELANITRLIGSEYRELGLALGLERAQLDKIVEDNPFKTSNRIKNILMDWKKMSSQQTFIELKDKMIRVQKEYVKKHRKF